MNQQPARGAQLKKLPLKQVFFTQVLLLLFVSAGTALLDILAAKSMLLGGWIAIAPNAYFAYWAFRYTGAQAASEVAQSFYRGEAGKFLQTTVLFAGVFAWVKPLDVVILFLSFIFMMALNWMLALRYFKR